MTTLTSYNTNIEHRGHIFHVQTEDKGKFYPNIETLVYCRGSIIYALKTSYAEYLNVANLADLVLTVLERQHQRILADLKHGKISFEVGAAHEDILTQSGKFDPYSIITEKKTTNGPTNNALQVDSTKNRDTSEFIQHYKVINWKLDDALSDQEFSELKRDHQEPQTKPTTPHQSFMANYVSGAEIQKSAFLHRVNKQSERRMLSFNLGHTEEEPDFSSEIITIMQELIKQSERLIAAAIVTGNQQFTFTDRSMSDVKKLLLKLGAFVSSFNQTLETIKIVGDLEQLHCTINGGIIQVRPLPMKGFIILVTSQCPEFHEEPASLQQSLQQSLLQFMKFYRK